MAAALSARPTPADSNSSSGISSPASFEPADSNQHQQQQHQQDQQQSCRQHQREDMIHQQYTQQEERERQYDASPDRGLPHPMDAAWRIIPCFQSLHIPSTIHFYTTELGFTIGNIYPRGQYLPTLSSLAGAGRSSSPSSSPPHSSNSPEQQQQHHRHQRGNQQFPVEFFQDLHAAHHLAEPDFCSLHAGGFSTSAPPGSSGIEEAVPDVDIHFFRARTPAHFTPSRAMIALAGSQLEELYDRISSSGIVLFDELVETPWGYRQFEIRDADGNALVFFQRKDEGDGDGAEGVGGEHAAALAAAATGDEGRGDEGPAGTGSSKKRKMEPM